MSMLTLSIEHRTHYEYSAPVTLAQHLAHLHPLHDVHQQLRGHVLAIDPSPGERHEAIDVRGNAACWFSLAQQHRTLTVLATSQVCVASRFDALRPAQSPPWDVLCAKLRYESHGRYDPAVAYALPSTFVPRLDALAAYARPSMPAGRPAAEAAFELMRRLHEDFRYEPDSTDVDTPLAQAFAQRSGVCQDFAHLLIGMLRMHGLPARYVSGYLLTRGPDGDATMLGADATHAWLQVYVPGTPGVPADGWLDLDPTNNLVPGAGHVRLAVGRDYGDVTPLRGVIRGGGQHRLSVAVRTRVVGERPDALNAA